MSVLRAVWAFALLAGALLAGGASTLLRKAEPDQHWTRWGGEDQAFHAPATPLATDWPESGPRTLWSREIGEGYSAILVEDGRLYTMHRVGAHEAVIALDAATGEAVWETRYEAPLDESHLTRFGVGPRSTPLLVGERLFTVGVSGQMHCLRKRDGKVLWTRDLWREFGGTVLEHGYSSSPAAYGRTVIVPVGGQEAGVVAFDVRNGGILWKSRGFENSYSSPMLARLAGGLHLVVFGATGVVGLEPRDGSWLWSHPHENPWRQNVITPVAAGDLLFISSPQAGARSLRVTRADRAGRVREVWSDRRIQIYHGTCVRYGDHVYGSTGTIGTTFLTAVDIRTGETRWRERGFAKANLLGVGGGRLLILDEDGELALASVTPRRLRIHARARVLDKPAWTVPTVVGRTAYLRDRGRIVAIDLG